MNSSNDEEPIDPALTRYVRDPVPEKYTVEIFEDLHAVIDVHLVEIGRERGSEDSDEALVRDWEKVFHPQIVARRERMQKDHGALLPFAFVASEMKMEFLAKVGHPKYQSGQVPDSVIEVVQEFVEIISYREEFEE
jgi:hypothetical protein